MAAGRRWREWDRWKSPVTQDRGTEVNARPQRFNLMKISPSSVVGFYILLKLDPALQVAASELRWDELPALPPWGAQVAQPRVTSPLVGVHAGALVVAGGAQGRDLGA